jgi:hypothetical protein
VAHVTLQGTGTWVALEEQKKLPGRQWEIAQGRVW